MSEPTTRTEVAETTAPPTNRVTQALSHVVSDLGRNGIFVALIAVVVLFSITTGGILLVVDLPKGTWNAGFIGAINGLSIPGFGIVDVRSDVKLVSGKRGGFGLTGKADAAMRRKAVDRYVAHAIDLVDADVRAGLGLDLLDHAATGPDHGTDALLRDGDGDDPRSVVLVVGSWHVQRLQHFTQDVQATLTGLLQRLREYFVRQAVHLHVHLGGGDAFGGTNQPCDANLVFHQSGYLGDRCARGSWRARAMGSGEVLLAPWRNGTCIHRDR